MNEHPYWNVLAVSTGLITIAVLTFLVILCCLAWTKWRHAREQRLRDAQAHFVPDEQFEAEHRQLLAEEGEQR